MTQPIDLVLDGSVGEEAIVIEGLRLVAAEAGYEDLQWVFHRLCKLRDELTSRRNWEKEVISHLADLPTRPRSAP